jgi:Second Messenger Oligonucleotide or Dinucleotide Synthetase domain
MKLNNTQIQNFINRIKLKQDSMPKYRDQVKNLIEKLETKIKDDKRTGLKVTRSVFAGSWAKRTILRHTGENPIDIDLVLYVEGDEDLKTDLKRLHDFVVQYLEEIYPSMVKGQIDAEGNTKSITLTFISSGLQVDIVPVIPLKTPAEYVLQAQRGGGSRYTTSISKQLAFASERRTKNSSYTAIVRAIKWWRNYKELKPTDDEAGLSSFGIELIVAYLDISKGVQTNMEEGIIRFFQFVSTANFPVIKFLNAINNIPVFDTPIFISDNTNNENNSVKKLTKAKWDEIIREAEDAFDTLNIAQSKRYEGETTQEWKRVFGPVFNITSEN